MILSICIFNKIVFYLFCKVFISDSLKCIFQVYFSECYYFDISTKVSLSAAENIIFEAL